MTRVSTIRLICLMIVSVTGYISKPLKVVAADRPSIVWIISEDNSKHYLKHFDPDGASAPNIEAMAQHGVTFDRAFSNAPVCSVARTTLITACYGPRIGTQFHRKIKIASMPDPIKMFPEYLRAAGYYTTNNRKEDYNALKSQDVWDESSGTANWKNRPDQSTPFFHVQSTPLSHEGRLHFPESATKRPTATPPESIRLQPYFPDTPTFRYTRALYHDQMTAVDSFVGRIIDDLREAGELENTFVFYFGDHGGVLPRSKGYLYESGLHVPLVVRVPEHFKHLAERPLASRTKAFVEFVDFGPTTLALAGVKLPAGIDGKPFLGPTVDPDDVDQRDETFGYADRFDEKYDLVRSLRQNNFKYIRNFEPFYPDALQNNYRYKALAYQEWRQLHAEGKLNRIQSQFFDRKPLEALYDLDIDPHETNNLVASPEHAERLMQMRSRLSARMKAMPDLSLIPEAILVDQMADPVGFGNRYRATIAGLIDTANLALLPFGQAAGPLKKALADDDPLVRYWAIVACSSLGRQAESLLPMVAKCLDDTEPLVAMRAVEFVALVGQRDPRPALYDAFGHTANEPEALRLFNTAVYLNDHCDDCLPIDPGMIKIPFRVDPEGLLQRRIDYLTKSGGQK